MEPSTKTLAEGCFGKVYKQRYGDAWAAVKKVPAHMITKEQLTREQRVYEKAQHNNVVRLLGSPWLQNRKWHIPLEFIFGEDLETTIFNVQKSQIQLTPSVKATIITGMCEGLNFLHSKDIVHQDLKPDNVMVSANVGFEKFTKAAESPVSAVDCFPITIEHGSHRAVIIDMGLAKFFKNGLSSAENMGNDAYSAPEIWHRKVRDKRSDVWAMGKIIAELCARVRFPTHGLTTFMIKDTLKDNPYSSVVSRMAVPNAAERANMAGVIGEIRQIEAGAGRPNPGLGVQGGAWGPAFDIGARRKWGPLIPFPPEAKQFEIPDLHMHHSPFPQPPPLFNVSGNAMANIFQQMQFPCPLPLDGMVVTHHELELKQIVKRNGQVVKYEEVKITK